MSRVRILRKAAVSGICASLLLSAGNPGQQVLAENAASDIAASDVQSAETEASDAPVAETGVSDAESDAFFEKEYLLPDSVNRCLGEEELAGWTRKQLEYGRYEIYARHGMLFDSEEITDYFSGKTWYFGFIKADEFPKSMLNEFEISNIELLQRLEDEAAEEEETTEKEEPEEAAEEPEAETEKLKIEYVAGTYTAYAEGYSSNIMVTCTFSEDGIATMGMNLSGESAGQGAEIGPEMIESILLAQTSDVDAISGATVTSDAIKEAVAECIAQAQKDARETEAETTEAQTEAETTEAQTEAETTEAQTEAATTEAQTEAETTEAQTEAETTEAQTEEETTEAQTEPETEAAMDFNRNEDLHDVDIMEEINRREKSEGTESATEKVTEAVQENAAQISSEYIFPDIDRRYLERSEVSRLSSQAVSYAKNELYARHGRKFASQELNDYFGSKSWYTGTVNPEDFTDKVFNEYERTNLLLIVEYDTYKLDQSGYNIQKVNEELSLFTADVTEATIAPESKYLSGEWIFEGSDIRYLTDEEVDVLSARVACYARYEIFARRGAIFTARELQEYFGNKKWYSGRISQSELTKGMFNQYELYNMELLRTRELTMEASGYRLE